MVTGDAAPFVHARVDHGALRVDGDSHAELLQDVAAPGSEDGVWARWRAGRDHLTVETDRYGMLPLYCAERPGELCVSTSVPALLARGAPPQLDLDALAVFVHLGYFLGDETPFRGIRAVPPGARLRWDAAGAVVRSVDARPIARWTSTRADAAREYAARFARAVGRRIDDRATILPLSGGRDSRHIALELARRGVRPLECVTARYFPPRPEGDVSAARALAARLGFPHRVVEQGDEFDAELEKNPATGYCSDEHAWFLAVVRHVAGRCDVVLDGIAGDVLSAGMYLTPDRIAALERGDFAFVAASLLLPRHGATVDRVVAPELRAALSRERAVARIAAELARHADAPSPLSSFLFWNRTRREIALSAFGLLGRAVRVRTPYLDREVFDLLASLPTSVVADGTFHTEVIRRTYPEHAAVPFAAIDERPRRSGAADRRFARRLLATVGGSTGGALLAPDLRNVLSRAAAFDRLRPVRHRLDPRLVLLLAQIERAACG